MQTHTFTGAGFGVRLAAFAALLLSTFSLAPATQATPITVIASFNVTNGQQPMCGVTFDAAGNMYGTTYRGESGFGGLNPGGVVWKIAHGTHTIIDLAQMDGYGADPGEPYGNVVVDANGTVYATASSGGTASSSVYGEVFKVVAGSGALTDLGDFGVGGNPGRHPAAGVTRDAAGDLFGTTEYGSFAGGTIWEIPAGGTLTTIASFSGGGPNGNNCLAGVTLDSQGNLYGTTQIGGVNEDGEVWELPHGSSTVLTLASFNDTNGFYPTGDVAVDASGNVYGTTTGGGANNAGVVWEVAVGTNTITDLATFTGSNTVTSANGYGPSGNVVLDGAGNLFGTTAYGGTSNCGTVWEIPKNGTLRTIASFSGANGDAPFGDVSLDAQGNLFGTTSAGGPADAGVVWEMVGVGVGGGSPVPTALTLTPNPAHADTTINGTVTFSQSVPAGTSVAITRNGTSLGSISTLAAGTTLGFTLPLPSYLNGSYTLGATLNGQSATQTLTVTSDPTKPVPTSIVFSPNPVAPGATIVATITLSGPAPAGGLTVEIFKNGLDLGSIPVAAGARTTLLGQSLTVGTYAYTAVENGVQVATSLSVSTSVAGAGAGHMLWTNANGQISVWNTTNANPAATGQVYGPFAGWTARAIAQGPNGNVRILWTNTTGQVALWNLADASPAATCLVYGPYSGWTAKALTVGPDNAAHLLWDNTSGQVALWNTTDANPAATAVLAGPYAGWSGVAIGIGANGPAHLLWTNPNGQVSVWNLSDANPVATSLTYGPYSGWSGQDLSVGADKKGRLLWTNVSGQMSLWNLADANPGATYMSAGPYSGWTAVSVAAGQ